MHERRAGCARAAEQQCLRFFIQTLAAGDGAAAVRLRTEKFVVHGFGMREFLQFAGVVCELLDLVVEELRRQ